MVEDIGIGHQLSNRPTMAEVSMSFAVYPKDSLRVQ